MYIVPVCPGTGQDGVEMPIGGFDPGLWCFFSLFLFRLVGLFLSFIDIPSLCGASLAFAPASIIALKPLSLRSWYPQQ